MDVGQKIKLEGQEYDTDNISEQAKTTLVALEFVTARVQELENLKALLQCAKNSYVENLKQEMISKKSGFLFEND